MSVFNTFALNRAVSIILGNNPDMGGNPFKCEDIIRSQLAEIHVFNIDTTKCTASAIVDLWYEYCSSDYDTAA